MVFGIQSKIDELEGRIRVMELKVSKCELREQQIIVLFKMVLDKAMGSSKWRMKDLLKFMDSTVRFNLDNDTNKKFNPSIVEELMGIVGDDKRN